MKLFIKIIFILACISVIFTGGCTLYKKLYGDNGNNGNLVVPIEDIATAESIDARLKVQFQPVRDYGYGTYPKKLDDGSYVNVSFLLIDAFKNLPPIPADFYKYKASILQGQMDGEQLCDVAIEYYVQPEFYANGFTEAGLRFYKSPDPTHWNPEGYGTFPHEMEGIYKAGQTIHVCTFFHTSWGVETYQGFSLHPVYPATVTEGGKEALVNSTSSGRYIEMDIQPKDILVEPAYLIFKSGWTKKVEMTVYIRNDTPEGLYAIGFDVGRASLEKTQEWYNLYASSYSSKGFISISEPQFKMALLVTK
jgi:hypothetical protein